MNALTVHFSPWFQFSVSHSKSHPSLVKNLCELTRSHLFLEKNRMAFPLSGDDTRLNSWRSPVGGRSRDRFFTLATCLPSIEDNNTDASMHALRYRQWMNVGQGVVSMADVWHKIFILAASKSPFFSLGRKTFHPHWIECACLIEPEPMGTSPTSRAVDSMSRWLNE